MRDEERIDLYYRFGTTDRRSEVESKNLIPGKSYTYAPAKYFRLASLLWTLALKNMFPDRIKRK